MQLWWSFKFCLKLKQRTFDLFAASEDERTLWIFVFNWIIKENKRIEDLKERDNKLADQFKKLTHDQKAQVIKQSIGSSSNVEALKHIDKTEIVK